MGCGVMLRFLAKRQFSINQLTVGGATYLMLHDGRYLTAAIVFVAGVAYCTAMDRITGSNDNE